VQIVALPIGLEQPWASVAGAFTAASMVATWTGLRMRSLACESADVTRTHIAGMQWAVDVFAPPTALSLRQLGAASAAIAGVAAVSLWISHNADWNFLLLN
jgi:hypothetical protein